MKEKFLYFAAATVYQVAQFLFEAAQKEHLKKCQHHRSQEAFRRFQEKHAN